MNKTFTRLFFCLIVLIATNSATLGQSLETKLSQKLRTYDSDKSTTLEQLTEVAQRFQLPAGIEWVDKPNQQAAKPVHLRNLTLREVISAIVNEEDGYRFATVDGVLQVYALSIAEDPRNFLNIKLPIYAAKNRSLSEISYWLRVRIRMALHPERNFGGGFGGKSAQDDFNTPTITFSVTDANVRTILSRIVVAQGNSLWIVHINPGLLMKGEPFYAQAVSPDTENSSSDFAWAFIPLSTTNGISH